MIRRVASMPSSFGMWTSIRTTSGLIAGDERHRLFAVAGRADDFELRIGLEQLHQQQLHHRRVFDDQDRGSWSGFIIAQINRRMTSSRLL